MSIRKGNTVIANKTNPTVYTAGKGITIENGIIASKYTFIFEQGEASATWTINHNLENYPDITVIDSGGNVVEGEVKYDSENTCTIKFKAAFKGKAYLN